MRLKSIQAASSLAMALLLSGLLHGCTLINPYVAPRPLAWETESAIRVEVAKPVSDLARDIKPDTIIVRRLKDYAWKIGVDVQRLRFDAAGVSESSGATNIEIPFKDQIKTNISQDPGKRIYQEWVGTGLSVDTSLVQIEQPDAASAITIKVNKGIRAIVENLIAGDPNGIIRRVLLESGQADQWRKEISGSLSLEGLSVTEIADPNTNLQKTVIHVPLLTRGSELAKVDMTATKSWITATFPNAQLDITLTTEGFTLRRGLNYARGAIDDYQDGLSHHAYLRTGMNLLLIPLAAAAVGMGVAGVTATSIAALSLSGGAVYGIGNVLSSRPREKLYAQGIKAINCAVKVMLPLNLPDSIYERLVIGLAVVQRNESSLDQLITEVSNLERKVEEANKNSKALSGTEDSLTRARSALAGSQKLRHDGSTLQLQIEGANDRLIQSVTEIQGLIAEQTVDTLPDISSVSFIVTGLAQQTQPLTGPAKPAAKQPKDITQFEHGEAQRTLDEEQLIAKRRELDALVDKVLVANEDIVSVINLVGSKGRPESLENCQVGQVVTGLTIVPSGPIEIGENQSKGIMLSGGKSPYVATLLDSIAGDSGDLLVVKQPDVFGPKIMIEGKKGVPPGNYNLYAADAAGHHQLITIVVAKQKPVDVSGPGSAPARQQEEIEKAVSEKLKAALPHFSTIQSKANPEKVTVGSKDGDSQSAVIKVQSVADSRLRLTDTDKTEVEKWVKAIFKDTVTITSTTIDAKTGTAKIQINLPWANLKSNLRDSGGPSPALGPGGVATPQQETEKAVSEKLKAALPHFSTIQSKANPERVTVGSKDGDSQSAVIKVQSVADSRLRLTDTDKTEVEKWVKAIFKDTVTITSTTIDTNTGIAKIEIMLRLEDLEKNLTGK